MAQEIERKFVLAELPEDLTVVQTQQIHQTYLAANHTESVRVRKIVADGSEWHTMTFKSGRGLVKEEIEYEIVAETYNQLLAHKLFVPLIKTRLKVDIAGVMFDLDIYRNVLQTSLITIEIEFDSEEAAHAFIAPDWFGPEVTGEAAYRNQEMWLQLQT